MLTVRDYRLAQSLTARAKTGASLKPGMVVVMEQGASSQDPPVVSKATVEDIGDATVQKFIVDYLQPDSLDVDFTWDPSTYGLTPENVVIPDEAQVNIWSGKIVVGYHDSALPTALQSANAVVADKVGFSTATGFPAKYDAAGAAGEDTYFGYVYRVDGPEVTMVLDLQQSGIYTVEDEG